MGNFLDDPVVEKETEIGESIPHNLVYSACSMQGWRRTMEDCFVVDVNLKGGEALFGVFDGHGG